MFARPNIFQRVRKMKQPNECVHRAIYEMIQRMKEEIAKTQSVTHPEQIVVAEIYYVAADNLAHACKKCYGGKQDGCGASDVLKKENITMDTFILLKQLREDELINEEYAQDLFQALLKMSSPGLKQTAEADRARGLI